MAKTVERWGICANIEAIPIDRVGDFSPGRWAWWITQATPVSPFVPASGHQWRWFWETHVALDVTA